MTLMVFDMGLRIATPMPPPQRRVTAPSRSQATRRVHDQNGTDPRHTYEQVAGYHAPLLTHSDVADLMSSPVISLPASATVADALALMQQHNIRHLPLLSETGPLALLSERDLLRAGNHADANTPALGVASRPVFCTCADTRVVQAASLMLGYRLGCLPVCDDQQQLIGMLTRSDLLRGLAVREQLDADI